MSAWFPSMPSCGATRYRRSVFRHATGKSARRVPRIGNRRFIGFSVALILATGSVWATEPEKAAAAEALFNEGLELLDAGKIDLACSKLHASQELDPGVGTLMYLGECHRRQGALASAWARFLEAATLARASQQSERATLAQAHADELMPLLSRMTVQVSPQASRAGLRIHRGNLLLQPSVWGSALPVDPGTYVIEATAPGAQPFRKTVQVGQTAERVVVEIPALLPERAERFTPPGPVDKPSRSIALNETSHPILHPITWGLAGLTLAASGLGTGFAAWAESIEADAVDKCQPGPKCAPSELDELERARRRARVAHISFAVAGVALVAATAWELHARHSIYPSQRRTLGLGLDLNPFDSRLDPRGVQVTLQGRFE